MKKSIFSARGNVVQEICDSFESETSKEAAEMFYESYGIYPDIVSGESVLGICERCQGPIMEFDNYSYSDTDSTYICDCCAKEMLN